MIGRPPGTLFHGVEAFFFFLDRRRDKVRVSKARATYVLAIGELDRSFLARNALHVSCTSLMYLIMFACVQTDEGEVEEIEGSERK